MSFIECVLACLAPLPGINPRQQKEERKRGREEENRRKS